MRQMAWAGAVQRAQPEQHEETPQHEWRNTAHLGDATQLISREIMGSLRAGAQDVPFAYEAAGVFGAIRVARSRVHCVHEVHEVRLRLRLRRLLLRRMLLPLQPLQQMRRRIVLIICWRIDRRSGSARQRGWACRRIDRRSGSARQRGWACRRIDRRSGSARQRGWACRRIDRRSGSARRSSSRLRRALDCTSGRAAGTSPQPSPAVLPRHVPCDSLASSAAASNARASACAAPPAHGTASPSVRTAALAGPPFGLCP
jgi:hypothetical protein